MSLRDELIALNLASVYFIASDGYGAVGVRTNEDAADEVLAWLVKHDAEVASAARKQGADEANAEWMKVEKS